MEESSMKNYMDSDYAVNKNAGGIVYRFADQTIEITIDDYLRENPGKTAADFAKLKALSDADYYESDRKGYRQSWKNVSFDGLENTTMFAAPSTEDEFIEKTELLAESEQRSALAKSAFDRLTETQRRRYVMYHVQGMTYREIAEVEQAHFTSIEESILAADKKIKKFLKQG